MAQSNISSMKSMIDIKNIRGKVASPAPILQGAIMQQSLAIRDNRDNMRIHQTIQEQLDGSFEKLQSTVDPEID